MATKASAGEESGRGRLQRESIVQTALVLMNEIGLDALSLRRLADELHVQAPALYWHFKNKQELLDGMAEAILSPAYQYEMQNPSTAEWADWLRMMGRSLRSSLLKYRDGARLLVIADVSQIGIYSLNLALGIMLKAGFESAPALTGITTIVNYTIGITFEEQSAVRHDNDIERLRAFITTHNLKHLEAAFCEMDMPPETDAEYEAGLSLIIDGLKTRHPQHKA